MFLRFIFLSTYTCLPSYRIDGSLRYFVKHSTCSDDQAVQVCSNSATTTQFATATLTSTVETSGLQLKVMLTQYRSISDANRELHSRSQDRRANYTLRTACYKQGQQSLDHCVTVWFEEQSLCHCVIARFEEQSLCHCVIA